MFCFCFVFSDELELKNNELDSVTHKFSAATAKSEEEVKSLRQEAEAKRAADEESSARQAEEGSVLEDRCLDLVDVLFVGVIIVGRFILLVECSDWRFHVGGSTDWREYY